MFNPETRSSSPEQEDEPSQEQFIEDAQETELEELEEKLEEIDEDNPVDTVFGAITATTEAAIEHTKQEE